MCFSVVCSFIDEYASSQWSKCCRRVLVVDTSTDHAKPHSICFFTTISKSKTMFFCAHIDERSVDSEIWTFIDNDKLGNQTARLVKTAFLY